MARRILIWHIPHPGVPLPAYYMEQDYTPEKVRIHAEKAPNGSEFEADIRDDGVTILGNRASSHEKVSVVYSKISYNTLAVSTFSLGEIVTGQTSGATGRVVTDKLGNMDLGLIATTAFTAGESILGATSGATAVVLSFYRGGHPVTLTQDEARTTVFLSQGENLEEHAEDFPGNASPIEIGSVLTCHVVNMGNANNVTIQLELCSLEEDEGEFGD